MFSSKGFLELLVVVLASIICGAGIGLIEGLIAFRDMKTSDKYFFCSLAVSLGTQAAACLGPIVYSILPKPLKLRNALACILVPLAIGCFFASLSVPVLACAGTPIALIVNAVYLRIAPQLEFIPAPQTDHDNKI